MLPTIFRNSIFNDFDNFCQTNWIDKTFKPNNEYYSAYRAEKSNEAYKYIFKYDKATDSYNTTLDEKERILEVFLSGKVKKDGYTMSHSALESIDIPDDAIIETLKEEVKDGELIFKFDRTKKEEDEKKKIECEKNACKCENEKGDYNILHGKYKTLKQQYFELNDKYEALQKKLDNITRALDKD